MANISLLGLSHTNSMAIYIKQRFLAYLREEQAFIPYPMTWDYSLLLECNHAASILAAAFKNQGMELIYA